MPQIFKAKRTANTIENVVYLRTFRPSTGAIINAWMLRNFQVTLL